MADLLLDRRAVLAAGLAAGVLPARLAFAAPPEDRRLVLILLRGAMDGIGTIIPYGDPAYAPARGALALAPGAGARKLDGLFAAHEALAHFSALYAKGEALAVHAVASPYRDRSHFDAQNVLETGASRAYETGSGWLNRALGLIKAPEAVAVGSALPVVLQGAARAGSWSPPLLEGVDAALLDRLMPLYGEDPALAQSLAEARRLADLAGGAEPAGGRRRLRLTGSADVANRLMAAPGGPRIVVIESGGWDTHAQQPGALTRALADLDGALASLASGAGSAWDRTVVAVITEFGRTVAVNGTGGTDHGTGSAALLAGGAVRGGQVVADWPGLKPADLYENRDLKPTLDLRAFLKGVLADHLGIDPPALGSLVFPGSAQVRPLDGLIRS